MNKVFYYNVKFNFTSLEVETNFCDDYIVADDDFVVKFMVNKNANNEREVVVSKEFLRGRILTEDNFLVTGCASWTAGFIYSEEEEETDNVSHLKESLVFEAEEIAKSRVEQKISFLKEQLAKFR